MRTNLVLFITGILTNIFVYFNLPERVPVHFNLSGRPDRWGSKAESFISFFIVLAIVFLIYIFVPKIDPKRKELWTSRAYHLIFRVIFLLFALLPLLPYLYLKGITNATIVNIFVGVLFILLGNYLPSIKPNYFVGIRTPWTLENETVWRKTHRIGGWSFVLAGVLLVISTFLPVSWRGIFFIVLVSLLVLFLTLYSYILWTKLCREK